MVKNKRIKRGSLTHDTEDVGVSAHQQMKEPKYDDMLQSLMEACTFKYIQKANDTYGLSLDKPTVIITNLGTVAGKASGKLWEVRYNIQLIKENLKEFLVNTVPHEVAHLIEYKLHGKSTHLKNWKKIMTVFGVEKARSYHTYDIRNCKRKRR